MKHLRLMVFCYFITALVLGCGGSQSQEKIKQIMSPVENGQQIMGGSASSVAGFRTMLNESRRVAKLLNFGSEAAIFATNRLGANVTSTGMSSESIAVYAFIIEKLRHEQAIPQLENYLLSNPADQHHVMGPTFVVRTLLVLKNLPDATGGYKIYSDVDIIRALSTM